MPKTETESAFCALQHRWGVPVGKMPKTETESDREEYFSYLNALRESGIVNMFGAAPHVAREFDIDIKTARSVLSDWMKDFKKSN